MKDLQLRLLQQATPATRNQIAQIAVMFNDVDTLQLLLQHYKHEFSAEAVQHIQEHISEIVALQAIADAQAATMH